MYITTLGNFSAQLRIKFSKKPFLYLKIVLYVKKIKKLCLNHDVTHLQTVGLLHNMKVICAGMPKTGTKSLCSALRTLGYEVYDFEEQMWFLRKELKKALDIGCNAEEYQKIFDGVDAVTDAPACYIWEEIFRAFPDAKVGMTKLRLMKVT